MAVARTTNVQEVPPALQSQTPTRVYVNRSRASRTATIGNSIYTQPQGGHAQNPIQAQPQRSHAQNPTQAQPQGGHARNPSQAQPQGGHAQNPNQAQPQRSHAQNPTQAQPQVSHARNPTQAQPQRSHARNPTQAQPQRSHAQNPTQAQPQGGHAQNPTQAQPQRSHAQNPTQAQPHRSHAQNPTQAQPQGGHALGPIKSSVAALSYAPVRGQPTQDAATALYDHPASFQDSIKAPVLAKAEQASSLAPDIQTQPQKNFTGNPVQTSKWAPVQNTSVQDSPKAPVLAQAQHGSTVSPVRSSIKVFVVESPHAACKNSLDAQVAMQRQVQKNYTRLAVWGCPRPPGQNSTVQGSPKSPVLAQAQRDSAVAPVIQMHPQDTTKAPVIPEKPQKNTTNSHVQNCSVQDAPKDPVLGQAQAQHDATVAPVIQAQRNFTSSPVQNSSAQRPLKTHVLAQAQMPPQKDTTRAPVQKLPHDSVRSSIKVFVVESPQDACKNSLEAPVLTQVEQDSTMSPAIQAQRRKNSSRAPVRGCTRASMQYSTRPPGQNSTVQGSSKSPVLAQAQRDSAVAPVVRIQPQDTTKAPGQNSTGQEHPKHPVVAQAQRDSAVGPFIQAKPQKNYPRGPLLCSPKALQNSPVEDTPKAPVQAQALQHSGGSLVIPPHSQKDTTKGRVQGSVRSSIKVFVVESAQSSMKDSREAPVLARAQQDSTRSPFHTLSVQDSATTHVKASARNSLNTPVMAQAQRESSMAPVILAQPEKGSIEVPVQAEAEQDSTRALEGSTLAPVQASARYPLQAPVAAQSQLESTGSCVQDSSSVSAASVPVKLEEDSTIAFVQDVSVPVKLEEDSTSASSRLLPAASVPVKFEDSNIALAQDSSVPASLEDSTTASLQDTPEASFQISAVFSLQVPVQTQKHSVKVPIQNPVHINSEQDSTVAFPKDSVGAAAQPSLPDSTRVSAQDPAQEFAPYRCPHCHLDFKRLDNLRAHMYLHTGEKFHQCYVCAKEFRWRAGLMTHLRVHTGEAPYRCEYCPAAFKTSANLRLHRKIHILEKPFRCLYCREIFESASAQRVHQQSHAGERLYQRVRRRKNWAVSKDLEDHHGALEPEGAKVPLVDSGMKEERVERNARTPWQKKPPPVTHECKEKDCGRRFSSAWFLRLHQRVHQDELTQHCPHCDARFKTRKGLYLHLPKHTGVRPHKCGQCGQSFHRAEALKVHMRLHTGDRPYKCPGEGCGARYRDRSQVRAHIIRAHAGESMFSCAEEGCDLRFPNVTELRLHYKATHGAVATEAERLRPPTQLRSAAETPGNSEAPEESALQNSTLGKSILEKSTLEKSTLENSTLQKSSLEKSTLKESTPKNSTLGKSILEKSTLEKSTLEKSTIDNSTLQKSALRKSSLEKSTLKESTPKNSTLGKSILEKSTLEKSTLEKLTLENSTLQKSTLRKSSLEKSTLKESTPKKSTLEKSTPEIFTILEEPSVVEKKSTAEKRTRSAQGPSKKPKWVHPDPDSDLEEVERVPPAPPCEPGLAGAAGSPLFACANCGEQFKRASILEKHQKLLTECGDCGEACCGNVGLVRHRRLHTGEECAACPDCGLTFSKSAHVARHRSKKHGWRSRRALSKPLGVAAAETADPNLMQEDMLAEVQGRLARARERCGADLLADLMANLQSVDIAEEVKTPLAEALARIRAAFEAFQDVLLLLPGPYWRASLTALEEEADRAAALAPTWRDAVDLLRADVDCPVSLGSASLGLWAGRLGVEGPAGRLRSALVEMRLAGLLVRLPPPAPASETTHRQ